MNDFDFDGFVQSDDDTIDTTTGTETGERGERTMGFVRMTKGRNGYTPLAGSQEEADMNERLARKRRKLAKRRKHAA